jgi:hypothetical protein
MAHHDTTSRYVERVRGLLRTELSEEELEMLLADLEDQLAPLDEAEIEGRIGSPDEFVDTYLASAGIDALKLGIARRIELWFDSRRDSAVGRMWTKYQPAWWLLRGWVMVLAYQLVYSPQPTFSPFPIPNVNELVTTSFAVTLGFIIGSMLLSRLTKFLPGRLVNILISAFAAYVAVVAAVNT